jgi:hypothetical protein
MWFIKMFLVLATLLAIWHLIAMAWRGRHQHKWVKVYESESIVSGVLIGKIDVYQCETCKKSKRVPLRYIK